MDPGPGRLVDGRREPEVGRPIVARPAAEVVGGPGGQVQVFQAGKLGLGIGLGEEQQRLDDPPEPGGVVVQPVQEVLVLPDPASSERAQVTRPSRPPG